MYNRYELFCWMTHIYIYIMTIYFITLLLGFLNLQCKILWLWGENVGITLVSPGVSPWYSRHNPDVQTGLWESQDVFFYHSNKYSGVYDVGKGTSGCTVDAYYDIKDY